ncbi:MAG TPA: hypothetical protein VJ717_19765, partial [Gemmatimonadaceae bacterium]|nr:hypothetical protein [Gemmatimonadaceae bacterium]
VILLGTVAAACSGESTGTETLSPGPPSAGVELLEDFSQRQVFPANNWWNVDISRAPVDANSQAIINWISGRTAQNPTATRRVHPDFGPPPYGIPYIGVAGDEPLMPITFVLYGNESDAGAPGRPAGYPVPDEARTQPNYIEGAAPGGGTSGDRHLIIIDRDRWLLYETWATRWNATASRWEAGSGATFDLSTNARRNDGWTSADAAGLAIFPGLVRRDEVVATAPIRHAFRVTTRATNGYVWPASHRAGNTAGAPPLGARLRLKASKDISGYPAEVQKIFQAMKTFGLIVADNGSDMYVTGTMDPGWDNGVLNPAFHSLTADDFEVIVLGWGAPSGVERNLGRAPSRLESSAGRNVSVVRR